jgi:1-deoxy-D-xylulose-5-phosphate synthase
MVIMAPKDENELRDMLYTATLYARGPIALRYPRGNALGLPAKQGFELIPIGKAETVRTGEHVALLAIGLMVQNAMKGAELLEKQGISAEVVNMRFAKPIDSEMLTRIASRFDHIVTLEDNSVKGGFGSGVAEALAASGITTVRLKIHGLPDNFIEHGTPEELHRDVQLNPEGIANVVKSFLREPAVVQGSIVGAIAN